MATMLVRNALLLATMDGERREIPDGGLFIENGFIQMVGKTVDLPENADRILDLRDHVVLPGLVNTHHHFYQTLTRAVPAAQNANLFNWLGTLYPIWAGLTPEDIHISTQAALCELALSGCTTAADHLYLFPNGSRLDDEIEAAKEIGLRLHASRGSMSLGKSQGGLPPDQVVDSEEYILVDSERLILKYHDPNPGSMIQIVLAPCSPFSVTPELMRQSAKLARKHGVHLHTHLAETQDEEVFCIDKFGLQPVKLMEALEWVGNDVWYAHSVYVTPKDIHQFADYGCGVAHCPSSNMRLASGAAPIWEMIRMGVNVGLGVDGSASNDSSHMLAEVRQALLLSRLRSGMEGASLSTQEAKPLITAREVLELATRGGAAVLGRSDLGSLEKGKCADFIAIDMNQLDFSGSWHDPLAALVFCAPSRVAYSVVGGKIIIERGEMMTVDVVQVGQRQRGAAKRLMKKLQ